MSKKELDSSLEKNFLTKSTFKRNTRYYDVPSIIIQENHFSIKRRKPLQSPPHSDKLESSFTNSTTALTSKLKEDVHKYKHRLSFIENKSDYEREYSSPGSPKLKSFSIDKMTSREYHHKLKNKPIEDERLFNNFSIEKHDLSQTCDFGKLRARKFDFQLKHINDLYHQSQKPFEHFYYTSTTMKQKVSYKRENKQQKRFFFRSKRKQDFPSTVMDPEKVDEGLKIASNFKGSNLKRTGMTPFYLETGRQHPCSLDMRYDNSLTNFRKDKNGKLIQPNLDFTVRKMKEDLLSQRKEAIKKSKKPQFTRNQLCDYKYFKAHEQQKSQNA